MPVWILLCIWLLIGLARVSADTKVSAHLRLLHHDGIYKSTPTQYQPTDNQQARQGPVVLIRPVRVDVVLSTCVGRENISICIVKDQSLDFMRLIDSATACIQSWIVIVPVLRFIRICRGVALELDGWRAPFVS